MTEKCTTCPLRTVIINEMHIAAGMLELHSKPGLAQCLLMAIDQNIEVPASVSRFSQNSLERQQNNTAGVKRTRALASCYLLRATGECQTSDLYTYSNADFAQET